MTTEITAHYHYGTGRRKNAIAQVRLYPGDGSVVINNKPWEEYFPLEIWRNEIAAPLRVTQTQSKYNVIAKVHGGGVHGQAGATRLGIARALVKADEEQYKPLLRRNRLLTRDSRAKESKKYGLKRARRAQQYTKR